MEKKIVNFRECEIVVSDEAITFPSGYEFTEVESNVVVRVGYRAGEEDISTGEVFLTIVDIESDDDSEVVIELEGMLNIRRIAKEQGLILDLAEYLVNFNDHMEIRLMSTGDSQSFSDYLGLSVLNSVADDVSLDMIGSSETEIYLTICGQVFDARIDFCKIARFFEDVEIDEEELE